MPEDDARNAEELQKRSRELQRLIDEAKRIQRVIADHLEKLRRGGRGEHTDGKKLR
jgi:hypothetical protein